MAWLERILKTWIWARTCWSLLACLLGWVMCALFFLIQTSVLCSDGFLIKSVCLVCLKEFRFCLGSLSVSQPSYTSAWWSINLNALSVFLARYIICLLPRCSLYNWGPKAKPQQVLGWRNEAGILSRCCGCGVTGGPSHLCAPRGSWSAQGAPGAALVMLTDAALHCWVPPAASHLSLQPAGCYMFWKGSSDLSTGFVLVWQGNANIAARNEGCQQKWNVLSYSPLNRSLIYCVV